MAELRAGILFAENDVRSPTYKDENGDFGFTATQVDDVKSHAAGNGSDHANVATNTSHSSGDGSDHSVVATNAAHVAGSGSDHADVASNSAHRTGDGSDHADVAANTAHAAGDGSDHADVAANSAAITVLQGQVGTGPYTQYGQATGAQALPVAAGDKVGTVITPDFANISGSDITGTIHMGRAAGAATVDIELWAIDPTTGLPTGTALATQADVAIGASAADVAYTLTYDLVLGNTYAVVVNNDSGAQIEVSGLAYTNLASDPAITNLNPAGYTISEQSTSWYDATGIGSYQVELSSVRMTIELEVNSEGIQEGVRRNYMFQSTATTTDATQTVIASQHIRRGTLTALHGIIFAQDKDDVAGTEAMYFIRGAVSRRAALQVLGNIVESSEETPAWDATATANTTTNVIEFKGTGAAGKTIVWKTYVRATAQLMDTVAAC